MLSATIQSHINEPVVGYISARIPGMGADGTSDHRFLMNRDAPNQHPIEAITELAETLDGKQSKYESYMRGLHIEKLAPFLYTAEFSNMDYSVGMAYFERFKPQLGGCSAVSNGSLFGRNYDWYYNNNCTFIVRTPAERGRHAVLGIAAGNSSLTPDVVDSGIYNENYEIVPYMLLDGMNDSGLIAEINVVPTGDKGITTGTNPGADDLCAIMIPRYVLDNAGSVDEAIEILRTKNIYAADSDVMHQEFHFMIADSTKTVEIEFVENELVVIDNFVGDKPIVTNFYLDGYTGTRASLTDYAAGIERQQILCDGYDDAMTEDDMIELMKSVWYTKAYSEDETPIWYSEFNGRYQTFGNLTKDSPASAYTGILEYVRGLYADRSRDTALTWHTVHTSVYDRDKKKLTIIAQETDVRYQFKLAYMSEFAASSGGCGEGTSDHRLLSNRSTNDQHPMSAITGLISALDGKLDDEDIEPLSNMEIEELLNNFV